LPYGDRDQTLFIDDEPGKAFQNPKWNELFLEPFRGREIQKQSATIKPYISVVDNVERFVLCKNDLHPFHSHHAIFETTIQFSIFILLLVQAI
jgi:hypothetical protein